MTTVRKLLVVALLAGGLTACDDSSQQGVQARRPYTNQQVLEAFAAAGIHLTTGTMARGVVPGLRAVFDGEGGVEVAVFSTAPSRREIRLGWTSPAPVRARHSRNVVVLYPKHTRVLPSIRRALARLDRRNRAGPFLGTWHGHTRRLTIGRNGAGQEIVDDGCCSRVVTLRFRITRVRGAVATVKVISARVDRNVFAALHRSIPKAGQTGTLRLRHSVVTDGLTMVTFCAMDVDRCGL